MAHRWRDFVEQKCASPRTWSHSRRAPRCRICVRLRAETCAPQSLQKFGGGEIFALVKRAGTVRMRESSVRSWRKCCIRMPVNVFSRSFSNFAFAAECGASNEAQGAIDFEEEEQMSQRRMSFVFTVL